MKYQKTKKSKKSNKKTNKSKTRKKVNKRYLKTQKKIGGVSFSSRFKQFFRPYKPFIIDYVLDTVHKKSIMLNNNVKVIPLNYGDVCIEIKKGFNIGFIYPEYVEDNHQPYYFSFKNQDIKDDKLPIYFEGPPSIPNKLYRKGKLIARRAPNNLGRLWPVKIKTMDGTAKLKLDGFNEANQPIYKPYKILQDGVYYPVNENDKSSYTHTTNCMNSSIKIITPIFCQSYKLKTNLTEIKDLIQLIKLLREFMDFVSIRLEKNTEVFSFGKKDFNKLDIKDKSEETIYNNIKSIINKGIRIVKNFISNYKTVFVEAVYSRLFKSLLVMEKTNEKIIKNEIRQINNLGPNNIDYQSVIKLNNSGNFNVNSKEQFFSVLVEKLMAIFKYALEQLTKNLNTALSEKDLIEQSKSKSEHVQIKLDKLLQNKDLSNTQIDIFLKEYEKDIDNNNRTNLLGFLSKKKLLASSQRAPNVNPQESTYLENGRAREKLPNNNKSGKRLKITQPNIYERLPNNSSNTEDINPYYARLNIKNMKQPTTSQLPHIYAKLSHSPTPYENVDGVTTTPDSSYLNKEPFNNSKPKYFSSNVKTAQQAHKARLKERLK
jgi:hypothetical protein